MRSSAGHISVTGQFASSGRIYNGMLRVSEILDAVDSVFGEGTDVAVRYSFKSAVYHRGLSKRLSFVGIDPRDERGLPSQFTYLSGSWDDLVKDQSGVLIPAEEARYLDLTVGDEIVLSLRTRFGAFNTGILTVRGIYESANYFSRDIVVAHIDSLKTLDLADADAATAVFVYLPSASRLSERRDALSRELATRGFVVSAPKSDSDAISALSSASQKYEEDREGRDRVMLTVSTLDEVLGLVRSVLAAVNGVGVLLASIMLFVIAVSIFINLRMTINERIREIGTLRAMGVLPLGVTAIFVIESVFLSFLFSSIGAAIAVAISFILRFAPFFPPTGNLALFLDGGHLALAPSFGILLAVIAGNALFAVCFSYFPARRGGSIPPVEALTKTF
jgi:ABC-type lipoprotein release transport system permease subunit